MASRARSRSSFHGIAIEELTLKQYTSHCVNNFRISPLTINDEVSSALLEGRGVVALETTIVVHGLPSPTNLEVAAECEAAVRDGGAVPATIGVLGGRIVVGLNDGGTSVARRERSSRCEAVRARPRTLTRAEA